jgi:hypothetical protein
MRDAMLQNPLVKRLLKDLLFALLVTPLVLYVIGGYFVYDRLTIVRPYCQGSLLGASLQNTPATFEAIFMMQQIDDTPYRMPEYETISFPARIDQVNIAAWFIPAPQPAAEVVIIAHGIQGCRKDPGVLLTAGMLHHAGFNVLALDLRNHGDSEIVDGRTAVGSREYRDVLGAFDYLLEQGFRPEKIGLVGRSLGAGTSIIAFGEEPRVAALWSDSGFADITETVRYQVSNYQLPAFFGDAGLQIARIMGINAYEHNPIEEISHHNERPIYLTHGANDRMLTVDFAYDLQAVAGSNVQIWVVEDTGHLGAIYTQTDAYHSRLVDFFTQVLTRDAG